MNSHRVISLGTPLRQRMRDHSGGVVRLAIAIPADLDLSPALALPLVACHPAPSRALLARALLTQGLIARLEGAELPDHIASSERLSASAPEWLDQWVYDVACHYRASLASVAARCVYLGLSHLSHLSL